MESGTLTRTAGLTTAAFLGFVLVDVAVPARLVSGAWWLVLLLVWIMHWPAPRPAAGVPTSTFVRLLALPVFAWLFFRAVSGLASAASALGTCLTPTARLRCFPSR